MTEPTCGQCQRALEPGELTHLHMTKFYDVASCTFWSEFPTVRMYRLFDQWLRETQQTQLVDSALPFLPPGVQDHQRLVDATAALRLALGLPQVRSLLDLLDAMLARLGVPGSGSLVLGSNQRPRTTNQEPTP